MTAITNSSFLYFLEHEADQRKCRQCNYIMKKGQLCFSRRRQKYLCLRCAVRLCYLTEEEISDYLYEQNEGKIMIKNIVQVMI